MAYVYAVKNPHFGEDAVMFGTTKDNPQTLLDLTDDKNHYYARVKKVYGDSTCWLRDVFSYLERPTGHDWFDCDYEKITEIFDMTPGIEWKQNEIDEITRLMDTTPLLEEDVTEFFDTGNYLEDSDVDDPDEYGYFSDEEKDYQGQRWD